MESGEKQNSQSQFIRALSLSLSAEDDLPPGQTDPHCYHPLGLFSQLTRPEDQMSGIPLRADKRVEQQSAFDHVVTVVLCYLAHMN